jgi:hypothetical protein
MIHLAPIITRIYEGVEAENRLIGLGLTRAVLEDVVKQGEYARAEATEHDPLPAGGMDAYRYRVRAFRDAHCPTGWTIVRERGLEFTVSPCGKYAVITRGGDAGVGHADAHPQPAGRVGDTTCDAIDDNSTLLLDANWMNSPTRDADGDTDAWQTWMLLVYRDGDSVWSELSLATGVRETPTGTRVLGWAERILLPTLDLSNEPGRKTAPEATPVVAEPTVTRRSK